MDRLNKISTIIILFLSFAFLQKSNGQKNENLHLDSESIFLITNSPFFVSGETLFYSFNCVNNSTNELSTISKVGHVELIDSNNTVVVKQKLFLKKGYGYGDFFISPKLKTGLYKIIGYTNWSLNNSVTTCFQKDIFILNQFENIESKFLKENILFDTITNSNISNKSIKSDYLSINLNTKTFSNRELVKLKIQKLKDSLQLSNLVFSVQKVSPILIENESSIYDFEETIKKETKIEKTKDSIIIPEYRGELIFGHITSLNNSSIVDKIISLSIPENNFYFTTTKTNQKGEFYLIIDKEYANSKMIIQIIDENKENYEIKINSKNNANLKKLKPFNKIKINNLDDLKDRSIFSQIENAYYSVKSDSIIKVNKNKKFFSSSNKEYKLDEFNRFSNLKDIIIEIIKEVTLIKNEKGDALYVLNSSNQSEFTQPALVLFDGIQIQDLNELFNYNMKLIDKVEVITGGYLFHSYFYNGVISFTSKDESFTTNLSGKYIIKQEQPIPALNKNYFEPKYENNNLKHIPDYRNLLKWSPSLSFIKDEVEIEFYTSDINGIFEIKIEGYNKNSPILLTEYIIVK